MSGDDVSVPDHPHLVGFITWSEEDPYAEIVRGEGVVVMAEGLAVREGIVYLAVGNERRKAENGLHIVDARDPDAPVLVGKVHFRDWVEGVYVAGEYAYVANTWLGVRSLEVRHLDRPALRDTFDVWDWIIRRLR